MDLRDSSGSTIYAAANCSFFTNTADKMLVVIQIPKQILWHHKNPRPESRDGIFLDWFGHSLRICFLQSGICKKRCRFSQNEWDLYGELHFSEKKSELPQPWLNQFSWAFGTPFVHHFYRLMAWHLFRLAPHHSTSKVSCTCGQVKAVNICRLCNFTDSSHVEIDMFYLPKLYL